MVITMPTVPASVPAPARSVAPSDVGAPFPGRPAIVDGSEAVASVESRISELAGVYPITPSTTMAAIWQAAVANGGRNLWGTELRFIEPESEHSSASVAAGAALAGARVTNFTAGQGLLLMKEVLYVIAGKRLPVVFHVGARALTSQGLNIHAGHDDLAGVLDVGWGMLVARNVQEAADLTAIARRAAEAGATPFFVAQDGFLTTHTMESIRLPEDDLLRAYVGPPADRLRSLFEPADGLMTGVVQNQDSYMKGRIAQRAYYDRLPWVLARAMGEWAELTDREYGPIRAHEVRDADTVVVAMGTLADTAEAVVDGLRARGRRVGAVTVTAWRPFPARDVRDALRHARVVLVVERTDDPCAVDGPLTRDVKAALQPLGALGVRSPRVLSAAAGLGSRDVSPGDLAGLLAWAASWTPGPTGRTFAVSGISHPLAVPRVPFDLRPRGAYSMRGHSIGGFGSVTTNKVVATLVGELFGLQVQAYPRYGSEKKGLPTTYYLTVASEPIRSHAELDVVDFVPVHGPGAFAQGDPLAGLVDGGAVFVQTPLTDPDEIRASLPAHVRQELVRRRIRLFALDTLALAGAHAPRADLVLRMQGVALVGVFLRVAPFVAAAGLDRAHLEEAVRRELQRFFGKRGGQVVEANLAVAMTAFDRVIEVPPTGDGPKGADDAG
jgi:pyruvate-ferredoxin/flavodoxin oxidoreductase